MSDAAIDSPPKTTLKAVTKRMFIQRMITGLKLHEALHVGNIGETDPKRGRSQLPGVLGVCHLGSHVGFASSNQPLFCGRLSRHQSSRTLHEKLGGVSKRVCEGGALNSGRGAFVGLLKLLGVPFLRVDRERQVYTYVFVGTCLICRQGNAFFIQQ